MIPTNDPVKFRKQNNNLNRTLQIASVFLFYIYANVQYFGKGETITSKTPNGKITNSGMSKIRDSV